MLWCGFQEKSKGKTLYDCYLFSLSFRLYKVVKGVVTFEGWSDLFQNLFLEKTRAILKNISFLLFFLARWTNKKAKNDDDIGGFLKEGESISCFFQRFWSDLADFYAIMKGNRGKTFLECVSNFCMPSFLSNRSKKSQRRRRFLRWQMKNKIWEQWKFKETSSRKASFFIHISIFSEKPFLPLFDENPFTVGLLFPLFFTFL